MDEGFCQVEAKPGDKWEIGPTLCSENITKTLQKSVMHYKPLQTLHILQSLQTVEGRDREVPVLNAH